MDRETFCKKVEALVDEMLLLQDEETPTGHLTDLECELDHFYDVFRQESSEGQDELVLFGRELVRRVAEVQEHDPYNRPWLDELILFIGLGMKDPYEL